MKKKILVAACIFTTIAHGMERLTWVTLFGGTIIRLKSGLISEAEGKRDFVVVGKEQPQMNRETMISPVRRKKSDKQRSYITKKDTDNSERLAIPQSTILSVIEPKIIKSVYWDEENERQHSCVMYTRKECLPFNRQSPELLFLGNEAVQEALKDLALCYENVLNKGLEIAKQEQKESIVIPQRTIAIPKLGIDFDFLSKEAAIIAVRTIIKFIEKHSLVYSCIELFVNGESELENYKKLLLLAKSSEPKLPEYELSFWT